MHLNPGRCCNIERVPILSFKTNKRESIGRLQLLSKILKKLSDQKGKSIIELNGCPGIGKTRLLQDVAKLINEREIFIDGIMMIDLLNETDI